MSDPGDDGGVIPSVAMAATTNPAGDGIRDDETVTDGNPLMLALRQQLRLEMIKTQHLQAELQLSRTQMKAETTARISLEVSSLLYDCMKVWRNEVKEWGFRSAVLIPTLRSVTQICYTLKLVGKFMY